MSVQDHWLGIDGLVFIGHGSSDAKALFNALKFAREMEKADLLGALTNSIQEEISRFTKWGIFKGTHENHHLIKNILTEM